jgi:predicted protein tyrosine phosphatase
MPSIHVSSLSRLYETVAATGASHVVTLINAKTPVERPPSIAAERHLFIGVSDILEPMDGHIIPGEEHVMRLNNFVDAWDRSHPLVIHCWAGISRSTAAAVITACRLRPHQDEHTIALRLRHAAPSATPNLKLVATADAILGRNGRMIAAIESIGRGADAFEGTPFELKLD